jgi:acyl-CoA synthetase (AMP-forming)/AMP-acid ligase II
MAVSPECNFAGRLVKRLGPFSYMIDAATDEVIHPSDLPRLISSAGAAFLSAGLKTGDRVLLGCALSPSSGIAYLGAMYAGLVAVPVEDRTLTASGDMLVQETNARAVWMEKDLSFKWLHEKSIPLLRGIPADRGSETIPPAACAENDLALLWATSGSTGVPRFVMISHGNLTANTEAIIRSQNLGNDERAMLILPLNYCFGASVFHSHLYQGGGVVFDRRFMFPDNVLRAIDKYRCTSFAGVPTVYNILLRRSNIRSIAMPSLRRFLQAGGGLAPQRIREMREAVPTAEFHVMYGQTEAAPRISSLDPKRLDEKLGSAGLPLDNLTVRIVDENEKDLPSGEVGEILVKGPSISSGYLNDPEGTSRVFKDGWLRTGDLAHLDEEGYIWIHGRKTSFLKTRGVRVSFAEVEATVGAVPGVYECAATAVPHEEVGEALVLWIVPDQGAQNIEEKVRRSLPVHWTCESIKIVSEIPKTSHGKILLPSLREK